MQQHDTRTVIESILSSKPVESSRVAVLNTIPLTQERFNSELHPGWVSRWVLRKPKDFLLGLVSMYPNWAIWEVYEEGLALPALQELDEIKRTTNVVLDFDVTWEQFQLAIHSRLFDVVFLLAHHFGEYIEFADGGVFFEDVKQFLLSFHTERKVSVIFMVCQAEEMKEVKFENITGIASIGCAAWNLPVRESYQFTRHWVSCFGDGATLADAYSNAIEQIFLTNKISKHDEIK